MKRLGFLGAFMALALVFLGVGYAAWTDAVTVTSSVATGEFEVGFSDVRASVRDEAYIDNYTDENTPSPYKYGLGEGVLYSTTTIDPLNASEVGVSVNNVYPGVKWSTLYKIENSGTIPAVYDYAKILPETGGDSGLGAVMFENVQVYIYNEDNSVTTLYNQWTPGDGSVTDLEGIVDYALDGLRLEPGQTAEIRVNHQFPEEITDLELTTFTYSFVVNFRQHNVLSTN